jgi:hypothetical protein
VKLVGPPETVAVWGAAQGAGDNQVPVTFTGSLKSIVRLPVTATSTAAFAGVVVETEGAASFAQTLSGEAVFLGVGAPTVKSAPF